MGGSGGGLFRYMYGRFLKEAAAITGDERLAEMSNEMREIGDQWQDVAILLRRAGKAAAAAPLLRRMSTLMEAIAGYEEQVWGKLRDILGAVNAQTQLSGT